MIAWGRFASAPERADRVVADHDPVPVDRLGVHPACAVDLPGRVLDRGDLVGQPRVPDRPGRGGAVAPVVAAGGGHTAHPARPERAHPVIDKLRSEPEPISWSTASSTAAAALERTLTCSSNSRIRCGPRATRPPAPSPDRPSGDGRPDHVTSSGTGSSRRSPTCGRPRGPGVPRAPEPSARPRSSAG